MVVLFIGDSECAQDDIERGEVVHRERTGDQHVQRRQQGFCSDCRQFPAATVEFVVAL